MGRNPTDVEVEMIAQTWSEHCVRLFKMGFGLMEQFTHETFLSPFTWRYGSDEMRHIWSDFNKRRLWRKVWVALAQAQCEADLVTEEQVAELKANQNRIDLARAHEIEAEIHHDLMAEIRTYAEQCPTAGGIIHLGATSMDIEDNADALRLRAATQHVLERLHILLDCMVDRIAGQAEHVCMAFTHLQPAEPTTVGYRLANYAQDLLDDWSVLTEAVSSMKGKGLKGAVGTSASYTELLHDSSMSASELEARVMASLDLEPFPVAHQTYPRRQDWKIVNALSGLAMTLYRLAFDIRLLQSPPIGEWSEPFGNKQVGSSAMPFKRNPIHSENLDSLGRQMAAYPRVMWDNAAHSLLERTLDDSGNRRTVLPEAFLCADEMLKRTIRIVNGLRINDAVIERNLARYGVFAATERVLMEAVRKGGDRQELHEVIREHSLAAWDIIQNGGDNPLVERLSQDQRVVAYISVQRVQKLLDASKHVGDAPQRALALARLIRETIGLNGPG